MFSGGAQALATTGHGKCPHSCYLTGGLPNTGGVGEHVLLPLRGMTQGVADMQTNPNIDPD